MRSSKVWQREVFNKLQTDRDVISAASNKINRVI